MQIPSAYASGTQALQNAQQGLAQATTTVAQPEKPNPTAAQDTVTLSRQAVNQTDKTSALVSVVEAGQQGEAAVAVLETANETVGSIIDIKV
ncbi:chemotaxis protein [Shewanella maritima]|uniref:chemotaxis protein n=1 Tax=Shewanella maritima TaxID=2520507 RepID=UPI003735BBD4